MANGQDATAPSLTREAMGIVDIATELISLIIAQRAYEVNSRSIATADEMLNTVNNMTR